MVSHNINWAISAIIATKMAISWFSDLFRAEIHGTLIPRILISLVHFLQATLSKQHAFGLESVFAAVDFVFWDGEADTVLILWRHFLHLLSAELFSEIEESLLFAGFTWSIRIAGLSILKLLWTWHQEAFVQLVSCLFVL